MNPEFYEDEVIEGFYVPSMIKKVWGAQMDVLNETDIICRRHNIPYFADWGTLLAAIRHGGYIPWDDDLDISMRRKDYERFLKYAEDELPEGFKVMNFKNHPGHHFFVARIVGKPRICFEEDHLRRFHGFPYIVGMDLFVLDNVCSDRKREKMKAKMAEFVIAVADNIADGLTTGKAAEEQLAQCEVYTKKKIDRRLSGEDLRIRMYELAEGLFSSIDDEHADALVQMMPYGMYDHELYVPKEYYRDTVRLPYMNTTISVPLCYDAVMRRKFGNYMEIHKTWEGHDYPAYYGQHRQLLAALDFEYPAYKASKNDILSMVRLPADPETDEPEDVVFIPFAPKYWKYMEKLYRHYAEDDGYRVWVVPIPYYYKAWDGSVEEEVFDTEGYPEDLYLQDYTQVDLESFHPAKIVVQNPFDEWNSVYTVPKAYYCSKLKEYTDDLVYIPFFVTDDFTREQEREYTNMDHYVCMPGVICADKVLLPSDVLRQTYIDKIMDFAGAADDENIRAVLEEKISVRPEFIYNAGDDEELKDRTDDGKKTVVFFTSVSLLAECGTEAIDKIRNTLDVFADNSDRIKVLWISQLGDAAGSLDGSVSCDFREAVRNFEKMGIGEYSEDPPVGEYERIARASDAYYGMPSALALRFFYEHKPVMIMNTKTPA